MSDVDSISAAKEILDGIYRCHPDMQPLEMDDGNIAIQYNHPAINVVLNDVVETYWSEIDRHHLDALTRDEVLITPRGPNQFDDFGKKALFGRCYFFMDAQDPKVNRIVRSTG